MNAEDREDLDIEFDMLLDDVAELKRRLVDDGPRLLTEACRELSDVEPTLEARVDGLLKRVEVVTERLETHSTQLRSLARERRGRLTGVSTAVQDIGLSLQSMIHLLDAQVEWLRDELTRLEQLKTAAGWQPAAPQGQTPVQRVLSWISGLRAQLKKVGGMLWNIIALLLTPKQWTLKGELGTGVLGLFNAGIEIQFGP
ncbi:MAG TPA: hypothetical protein VNJ51_01865 [Candidatus Dormibacteraeota bacterium]|nr:hypothetical protein [Candidatus Dormibacteraeota bacterium]